MKAVCAKTNVTDLVVLHEVTLITESNMDLSIIIVNYKTEAVTLKCLKSVFDADYQNYTVEVIVVDNASGDGSAEAIKSAYPQINLIINDANLGFSKANNIGIRAAKGDYVLLLNSDTEVRSDTISRCLDYIKRNPDIGALGCKVLLSDGSIDPACKRSFPTPLSGVFHTLKLDRKFPNSKVFGAYDLTYLDENKIYSLHCITGAFMMVPMNVINAVGMLDEDYFMYGEDIDWCYRVKQAGYKVVYYPKAEITHYKRVSGFGKRNPKVVAAFYDAMTIFYDKHYRKKYSPLTRGAVNFGTKILKARALKKNAKAGR